MGAAVGSMLGFAAAVAVSPLPIVTVILLLATANGRRNGVAFVGGWVAAILVVGTVTLLLSGSSATDDDGAPATWSGWVKLALGALLVAFSVRQWRTRPQGDETPPTPKWMQGIDKFSATKAFGFGAVLSGLSPKNTPLIIAAGLAIAGTGASGGEQTVAIVLFALIASIGVLAPVVVSLAGGAKAASTLEGWHTWFVANNGAIMAVLFFVIGLKLVGDGLSIVG